MRHLSIMVNDEKSEKGKYEENSEKMREMLNRANREIAKLKQDAKVANENSGISKKQFEEFKREKESEARSYETEIDRLRKHLDELEEEHEELKSHIQVKSEINTRVEAESNIMKVKCWANIIRKRIYQRNGE
jgi:prefoldin subunit 5